MQGSAEPKHCQFDLEKQISELSAKERGVYIGIDRILQFLGCSWIWCVSGLTVPNLLDSGICILWQFSP